MRVACISILDAIGPTSVVIVIIIIIIIIIIMDVRIFLRPQHHFSTGRSFIMSSPYSSVTYTRIAVKYYGFAH